MRKFDTLFSNQTFIYTPPKEDDDIQMVKKNIKFCFSEKDQGQDLHVLKMPLQEKLNTFYNMLHPNVIQLDLDFSLCKNISEQAKNQIRERALKSYENAVVLR
ncbi:hypothetical protein PPERSA_00812 [Pseudocohnilembus persalinus]|uniref:Uncharacterized protein n=1 Tax=Pseudocohnilembus persalinus TaxID=266149 RepID=A0A0V0QG01_PSEPJ|nr:hypothetical protein PPERSA_00812 [Pseudocohnilembus persalinus]|eukprot:KRX01064.1 hypothetical protein PPERSA_00812 [Pseudocohnilembus persalinus]